MKTAPPCERSGIDARPALARPRFFYGWTIVVALGVTTILAYGTNQYLYALLLDPVAHELGWSRAALAAGFSGVVLVSGFAGMAAGPIVDRYGARLPLSAGSVVSGLVLLALSRTSSLAAWDALWTVGIGVGSALTYYPITMTVVANWFARRRTSALGLLTLMGAFSSTITYPSAGLLIARFGWREALVVLALAHLLVALPLHALIVRRRPEDFHLAPDGEPLQPHDALAGTGESARDDFSADAEGTSTDEHAIASDGATLRDALRMPAFWSLTVALSLAYFASTAILLQHVAYLVSRGYAPPAAASLVGLIGLAYIPGRIAVALLGARISFAAALGGSFVLEAFGIAALALHPSLAGVLVYVFAFGAAYGAMSPLRGAIAGHYFGRRAYGAIFGAQGIGVAVASAAAPIVTANLASRSGYSAAFLLCAAALLAAAIALLPLARARSFAQRRATPPA
ncbi:MAG TPA: MFS transporter [Candidatus Baltobacteraceae bacterium]|nr:MFS transporter [Candidatus Baltobacteraceae bacterium]